MFFFGFFEIVLDLLHFLVDFCGLLKKMDFWIFWILFLDFCDFFKSY